MGDNQFEPYPWSLKQVVEQNFYEVPIYQRPYTWSTPEVNSLLDDIFSAYRSNTDQSRNCLFTGQLFLRKMGKGSDGVKDKYEVVDGQQRLTTFSMILIAIFSIARKRGFKDEDKEIADLRSFLWKYSQSQRNYNKNERLITLSSIDKDLFQFIFDSAYDSPTEILKLVDGYPIACATESNLRLMLHKVYERIEKEIPIRKDAPDEILHFLSFLCDKTLFIAIQSSIDMPRVFSVFESINSKGKPLDDIDKIKTYIFSILEEKDYSSYLMRWGQLIIKTDDKLEEYLQVYIKAFLFYYRQKINLKEFKAIARCLPGIYGVSSLAEALKRLIDEMLAKADSFALLGNEAKIEKLINKPEFTTFYKLYSLNGYSHPKSLFFRAMCEYLHTKDDGTPDPLITKEGLTKIVKSATLFMFKFQSIKGGDSKDAIRYFENIGKNFYGKVALDPDWISSAFANALIKEGVDKSTIRSDFINMDFYSKRDLAYCVLSLLESIDTKKNKDGTVSNKLLFAQASAMLSHIKDKTFQVDHMLPQSPDKNEPRFKYYKDDSKNPAVLVLKEGNDFPKETVIDGMRYDEFESRTINHIGNIQLLNPQKNEEKGNGVYQLPNHEEFTTYQQVLERCQKMADLLFDTSDLN